MITPLTRPREYLEAVAVGIKLAEPSEIPSIIREIARNLNTLADAAERYTERMRPPDDSD
jgi:hypothetical protein